MPRRIDVDLEGAVFFLNWIGQCSGTEIDCMGRRRCQIGHGQVEMNLLWLPVWPFRRHKINDMLKGQLQWQFGEVDFAPRRVSQVNTATEQVPVEGRQSRGIWTIKDD